MKPLSPRKRRVYLLVLVALFFIALPAVIFYARGYRFWDNIGFIKTGGIFLSVPYANAKVSLNGEKVGESGLLKRSFYLGDLAAGTYSVEVTREGSHPWHRILVVAPELVTDADVFLIPTPVDIVELSFAKGAATTTRSIPRPLFSEYSSLFDAITPTTTSSRMGTLMLVDGDVTLRWLKPEATLPTAYCEQPSICVLEISLEKGKQEAIRTSFFEGGIVYATKEGGVFIAEADVRPTPLTIVLYSKPGSDFRIIDNQLVVKDGDRLYEILGL